MVQISKHGKLVKTATIWLEQNKFTNVEYEFKVHRGNGLLPKTYQIDIVVELNGIRFAIECGGSKPDRLDELLESFDYVFVFPHGWTVPYAWRAGMNLCKNCGQTIEGGDHDIR